MRPLLLLALLVLVAYLTRRREPVATWDEADEMCPNCVTPWKCNGPHLLAWRDYERCDAV